MRKSNQEKHKAGIGNATEIAICDTLEERTPLSRQVQQISRFDIYIDPGPSKFARVAYVTMHQED